LGKISPPIPPPSRAQAWGGEKIDKKTLNQIEQLVEKIDDEEVRKELREVLIRGAKLERFRKKSK